MGRERKCNLEDEEILQLDQERQKKRISLSGEEWVKVRKDKNTAPSLLH